MSAATVPSIHFQGQGCADRVNGGNGAEPEPFLQPVKREKAALDEDASPTAGRRFSRA